jgi:hypothetical protein
MTDRSETIGVRVTPNEREKFEEYLETEEGKEHTSVSDLMRTATHRIVSGDDGAEIDTDEIVRAVETSLSDVSEHLDSMDSTLTVLLDTVRDDDEIHSLAARIYEHLPAYRDESVFEWTEWNAARSEMEGLPDDPRPKIETLERARKWSDVRAWADYFDESQEKTQRALSVMLTQYPDSAVAEHPTQEDPIRRYYRKES